MLKRLAKRLLPKRVRRWLLQARGVNRPYADLPGRASRRCLEAEIIPWMRARCQSVLFVGTASYTWQYEKLFQPGQYTTMDTNPGVAVWGASRHIVASVQELARHRPPGSFDGVILNGVLGFGLDAPAEMRRAFEELRRMLPPGGALVVGWNTDRHDDPEALGLYGGFERHGERRSFPEETHVYDVLISSRPEEPKGR